MGSEMCIRDSGNTGEPELAGLADRHAVTDAEVGGVVTVARAEARKARCLAALTAVEEGRKRLVELPHHLLLRRRRPSALMRQVAADHRQAGALFLEANRHALLIRQDAVFEGCIVKLAEVGEHLGQERGLRLVRLDPVSVAQYGHGLLALLVFDVLANGRFGDVPDHVCEAACELLDRQG